MSDTLTRADAEALEAGLDALDRPTTSRNSWRRTFTKSALPPIVAIIFFVAVWWVVYTLKIKPTYVIPSPADAWSSLQDQWSQGNLQKAVWNSLRRAFVGFGISLVVGTILGLFMAQFRFLRAAIGPLVSGLQSLPSVAWVPAAIIWFGLSDNAMYMVVLFGAVPSIANGLLAGVAQVPPIYSRVGQVMGARGLSAIRYVTFPAALPGYFSGLRQGWAFAWRSLMAAELIALSPALGVSLGQLLDQGRELSDMSLVVAAIILILIVGVGIELIIFGPIERRLLRSRGLLIESR